MPHNQYFVTFQAHQHPACMSTYPKYDITYHVKNKLFINIPKIRKRRRSVEKEEEEKKNPIIETQNAIF
jgi:hypothetical protein